MILSSWPGDASTVERWLRAMLSAGDGFRMDGSDRIRIDVALDGDDIETLDLIATRVNLRPELVDESSSPGDGAARPSKPAEIERRPAVLRHGRLSADPVRVHRIPIRIDATLDRLPIAWVRYERPLDPHRPETAFTIDASDPARDTVGSLSATMRTSDVGPLLLTMMRPAVAAQGLRLHRLDIAASQDAEGRILIDLRGSARWKLLAARVRAGITVRVAPDAVVTVERLHVSSRNILVAVLLRFARAELRDAEGRSYDLNGDLAKDAALPRLRDVRVTAGEEISVSARLG
ncbi:hypothetical protein [Microbacterium sp. 22242]|uniref:hypothetical protein n=1 Tax=Microbacterium sp. 22242 TaxID=3453896 RepID=UPI003F875A79